jgi:hypothetical protein
MLKTALVVMAESRPIKIKISIKKKLNLSKKIKKTNSKTATPLLPKVTLMFQIVEKLVREVLCKIQIARTTKVVHLMC